MKSIRRDLLAWLLIASIIAAGAATATTYYEVREEANELFDYQLKQTAPSIPDHSFGPPARAAESDIEEELLVEVWNPAGQLVYSSEPGTLVPLASNMGFNDIVTAEGRWRAFTKQTPDNTIQVAQPWKVREALAATMAFRPIIPLLAILFVLGLVVWIIVLRGLEPLARLAQAVRARTPTALQPLAETQLPEEVLPLVQALNDLLARLERILAAQKGFVADAAHQLRTPLTAITLQLELTRLASSPEERESAIRDLQRGMSRVVHLVSQLLTLARQEPEGQESAFERVDLSDLAGTVVAEQAPLAAVKALDLGLVNTDDGSILGDPEALRVMLDNLVDNAIRYSPSGGRIDVKVFRLDAQVILAVQDSGPGIPLCERERVFDRFFRGRGVDTDGSGLGLAIVKKVAQRHGATVELSSGANDQGLVVSVSFKPDPAI